MDIFDFAQKMELDGKSHYEKLAAQTSHPGLRTIFLGLADDEQKHYDTIQSMKTGLATAMFDSPMLEKAKNVFKEVTADQGALTGLKEDMDGYLYAMRIEKDSVKLYEDAAKKEQNPEVVQIFLKIANEEKKHYNIMENLYDFVLRPTYFLAWREFTNLEQL